jgi:hypothetical protein
VCDDWTGRLDFLDRNRKIAQGNTVGHKATIKLIISDPINTVMIYDQTHQENQNPTVVSHTSNYFTDAQLAKSKQLFPQALVRHDQPINPDFYPILDTDSKTFPELKGDEENIHCIIAIGGRQIFGGGQIFADSYIYNHGKRFNA